MTDIILFGSFILEVILLTMAEKKLWGTLYTPLNCLVLPFCMVLLIVLTMPSSLGFVHFYAPSLLIWMGGMLVMAIPSWALAMGYRKNHSELQIAASTPKNENLFYVFCALLIIPFLFRVRGLMSSSLNMIGSDEFGEEFAVYGFFGHLLILLLGCSIVLFSSIRKGNRIIPILLILAITLIAFLNQVKSWVMIPLMAGMILCLLTEKMHLSVKVVSIIAVSGIVLFMGSYFVMFIVGNGAEYNEHMGKYVLEHMYHYVASGILGMSEDVRMGILEQANPDVLFAPFINAVHAITGDPYVSAINPHYLEISTNNNLQDNVRTFFGTIYVNSVGGFWILVVTIISSMVYLVRIWAIQSQSIYILAMDAWFCALLAMGWFEYYFFHVTTFEVPVFLILLYAVSHVSIHRKEAVC